MRPIGRAGVSGMRCPPISQSETAALRSSAVQPACAGAAKIAAHAAVLYRRDHGGALGCARQRRARV